MKKFRRVHNLDVSNNHISDISGLEYMLSTAKEVYLDISYNPVKDLMPLERCKNFSSLILSGIDLTKVEGVVSLRDADIFTLTAENCNLDNWKPIETLSEARIFNLNLSNNQLEDLSSFINKEWDVHELNVTAADYITDDYMQQIGAFKVAPGLYQYGNYSFIRVQK